MGTLYDFNDHPVIEQLMRTGDLREYETYRCPCCGGDLSPEEFVFLGDEGVIGCGACICTAEAQDALGPDTAA